MQLVLLGLLLDGTDKSNVHHLHSLLMTSFVLWSRGTQGCSLGLVAQPEEPEHTPWGTWGVPEGERNTVAGSSGVCLRQQKK